MTIHDTVSLKDSRYVLKKTGLQTFTSKVDCYQHTLYFSCLVVFMVARLVKVCSALALFDITQSLLNVADLSSLNVSPDDIRKASKYLTEQRGGTKTCLMR